MLPAALLRYAVGIAAVGPVFLFARSESHWPLCQVEASVARCGSCMSWPWTSSPRLLARPFASLPDNHGPVAWLILSPQFLRGAAV